MQYLAITAAFISIAVAAPTSAPLERRACSVAYPRTIGFPINYVIKQDAGKTNSVEPVINFDNIPAGAYGCQLEVNFPAGYPIQSSGSTSVNVWSESGASKGSLFGTVTFTSSPVAPTKYVINSATCASLLSYRLSIASDTLPGSVAFADTKEAGITVTYNC
ncbi:hypothetical protein B0J11DRAFT_101645 [Dendryphion nanum]|uniref:Ubiquitin 3 binding protein But2 C-terminal domain-containing protein n=1 Tax=Dendryphion nanum TaxID=256645 RepID=A0A9P9IDJ0_9PLEO|nr:hypothetical protein B0J11DRAFT_101645 [Dendryphion nanum]